MRKLITVAVAVLAIGLWLMPISVAAQGRSVGRPDGRPGGFGSHAPLGAPAADAGTTHGSAHDTATSHDATASGPKVPATLLSQNKQLATKLESLLGLTGTTNPLSALQADANGYKNLGRFVAAVHVSQNLKIPFTELKCTEMGTTKATSLGMTCPASVKNASGMSLGASIDALKPGTNGRTESQKALTQANQDMKGSG